MIIISEQSFVILGEDLQTPKKVKQGVVKFTTPSIGKVTGWVTFEDALGTEIINGLITEYEQSYFTGEKVDILLTLSEEFLITLSTLNPSLTITVEI
jgi:hypothetical protein